MRLAPLCLLLVPWLTGAAPSEPSTSPYAATHFKGWERDEKIVPKDNEAVVPLIQQVRAGTLPGGLTPEEQALLREVEELSRASPSGRWYATTFRERFTTPEELTVAEYVTDLVALPSATLSPAGGPGPRTPLAKSGAGIRHERSNLRVLEGSASKVRKVYFTWHSLPGGHWSEETTTHVLAVFEQGRLARLVQWRVGSSWNEELVTSREDIRPTYSASVLVPTWRDGKVSRVEQRVLRVRAGCLVPREDLGLHLVTTTFEAQAR
jgi:hypothetical protein